MNVNDGKLKVPWEEWESLTIAVQRIEKKLESLTKHVQKLQNQIENETKRPN